MNSKYTQKICDVENPVYIKVVSFVKSGLVSLKRDL